LGTASPKLELLHSCVPKLELGNKKQTARAIVPIDGRFSEHAAMVFGAIHRCSS
jgi:hypothetical protein